MVKLNSSTVVLASIPPNKLSVWNFYDSVESAELDKERANRETNDCYEVMTFGEYESKQKHHLLKEPMIEVSEEKYMDALETFFPEIWVRKKGFEYFMMNEYYTGTFTTMYAVYQCRFFSKMVDVADTSTYITPKMCEAFIQEELK